MKNLLKVTIVGMLMASPAFSGGWEASRLDSSMMYQDGSYAEVATSSADYDIKGTTQAGKKHKMAKDQTRTTLGFKTQYGDFDLGLTSYRSGAIQMDGANGHSAGCSLLNLAACSVVPSADVEVNSLALLARYRINENMSVLGGLNRYDVSNGTVTTLLGHYVVSGDEMAPIVGAAYENKEIALNLLSKNKEVDISEVKKTWKNFYSDYFESFNSRDLALHAKDQKNFNKESFVKIIDKDPDSLSTIMICTKDRANVFATIIGILDSENINFLDAKLFGMKNGFCLDFITISNQAGEVISKNSSVAKSLTIRLKDALDQEVLSPKIVKRRQPKHLKHFNTDTIIKYKHDMTHRWTEVDIKTSDRPGLLASICQVFLDHGALIRKARIATYGERAEDKFCITSKENTPYLKKKDLERLINDMSVSLSGVNK